MSNSKYAHLPWISSQLCLGSHLDPASVLFPAFPHPDQQFSFFPFFPLPRSSPPRSTPCDDPGEVAGTGRGSWGRRAAHADEGLGQALLAHQDPRPGGGGELWGAERLCHCVPLRPGHLERMKWFGNGFRFMMMKKMMKMMMKMMTTTMMTMMMVMPMMMTMTMRMRMTIVMLLMMVMMTTTIVTNNSIGLWWNV